LTAYAPPLQFALANPMIASELPQMLTGVWMVVELWFPLKRPMLGPLFQLSAWAAVPVSARPPMASAATCTDRMSQRFMMTTFRRVIDGERPSRFPPNPKCELRTDISENSVTQCTRAVT
jgi:hypothetical protein